MSLIDLVRMALHNFRQRKLRTALNLTGIVTGCVVLLMTAAGGAGVKDAIHLLFDSAEFTRQIYVWPGGEPQLDAPPEALVVDADVSDERRERIQDWLETKWRQEQWAQQGEQREPEPLDRDLLDELRRIPHVLEVTAESPVQHSVTLGDVPSVNAVSGGMRFIDASLKNRLLAGNVLQPDDRDGVLVSEITAWELGFQNDAELQNLIGKTLSLRFLIARQRVASLYNMLISSWGNLNPEQLQGQADFVQTLSQLLGDLDRTTLNDEQKETLRSLVIQDSPPVVPQETMATREFTVRGIFHEDELSVEPALRLFRSWFHNGADVRLLLHPQVSEDVFLMRPDNTSFYNATLLVDRTKNLESVTDVLKKRGLQAESSLWILQKIDSQVDRGTWVFYAIAGVVLLTAGIGIFNTLVMSVLERTPEFGIMKSLGARNSDLTRLMLIEGVILGFVGAVQAMLVSVVLAWCGRSLLKMYVESQTSTPLGEDLFRFHWLPAFLTTCAAVFICVVASVLPAIRAARLDPVVAMRRT